MENKKIDSRASQTKPKQQKKVWTPPSSLDAPPAPDGYKHRWIRLNRWALMIHQTCRLRLDQGLN